VTVQSPLFRRRRRRRPFYLRRSYRRHSTSASPIQTDAPYFIGIGLSFVQHHVAVAGLTFASCSTTRKGLFKTIH